MHQPKYRHHKARDTAVVRIKGVDHYLGKYNSKESFEKYHRLLAEGDIPEPVATDTGPTVDDAILAFLKAHTDHYRRKDGTETGEMANFIESLKPLKRLYGSTLAKDFSPKALKTIRQSMLDAGLARTTINQRIGRIVHVFKWAVSEEMVPPSLHHGLKTVSGLQKGRSKAREPEPVLPVPEDRVDAVKPHVVPQVRAMIDLQLLTGMRPGEVVLMRNCDIDKSESVWIYVPHYHKREHHAKGRPIAIGPRARLILEPWLRTDGGAYLFSPAHARAERFATLRAKRRTKVQPSQRNRNKAGAKGRPGSRYSNHTYYNAVRRGCARAFPHPTITRIKVKDRTPAQASDIKKWDYEQSWHPSQLRHTAGTRVRLAFDLDTSRAVLGHEDSDTTEIYAVRDREIALAAIAKIG